MPSARETCAGRRAAQLDAARQPDERQARGVELGDERRGRGVVGSLRVAPGERQAVAAREVDHPHRGRRRVRADDLEADALDLLQRLAPRDERREQQVAERPVLEEQRAQRVAVDRDVAQRLRSTTAVTKTVWPESRFISPRKPDGAVADDLVAGGVEDRDLALEDRDERVASVADAVEHVADGRGALLSLGHGASRSSRTRPRGRTGSSLAEARAGVAEALRELRDLARGIHPPVLSDPAWRLRCDARRSERAAVSIDVELDERLDAAVEAAAYFVVAEALANAAKHSGANRHRCARAPRRGDALAGDRGRRTGWGRSGRRWPHGAPAPGGSAGRNALDREPCRRPDDDQRGVAMRIVIAEDLALLRDGMTRLLEDNGFDVVAAVEDAPALMHAVRRERPDVAIVDIRLPPNFRDEGLRAALELRRSAPETAILVVSQYVEHTYASELLAEAGGGGGATSSRTT